MTGIAEMFAELDGRLDYEVALAAYMVSRRKSAVEATRQWRKNNPAHYRALQRSQRQREKERAKIDPVFAEKRRAKKRAQKKRRHIRNPEAMRATWRRNTRAYRERKRARTEAA